MIQLVVGLGNPGGEYRLTRHNAGFWAIESYLQSQKKKFAHKSNSGNSIDVDGIHFFEPLTYMNNSGEAVAPFIKEMKIEFPEMLVIHDEADLPVGKIQLKFGGGTGGHNGLVSLVERLGSPDFWRLRIGVDKDPAKQLADYVLEKVDQPMMEALGEHGGKALALVLDQGPEKAINQVNSPGFQRLHTDRPKN